MVADRLYRSRDERVVSGVCGGIADRYDLDPSLVRIVFALLVLSAGVGLVLYIVMALVVPEEPLQASTMAPVASAEPGATEGAAAAPSAGAGERVANRQARREARRLDRGTADGRGAVILGAVLVVVGAWFLIRRYIPALDEDFLGPLAMIVIGGLLVFGALNRGSTEEPRQPR